jgi:hypothetical protein
MHKVLAAFGLAVAVPVVLATPALAKDPVQTKPSVSSVLRQHEGFRAEVTYLCIGPKHQEGTINVFLQQPGLPGASTVNTVNTVATAHEKAKCDGKEREEKIKIPTGGKTLRADQTVWLYTTLVVNGNEVAHNASPAEPVSAVPSDPTASPTSTESPTPSSSPSPSDSQTGTESPSASASPSESETETASPSTSPTATS